MADPRVTRLAHVLVDYSTNVQPGQKVGISGPALAAPLIEAVYERVIERGAHPDLFLSLPGLQEIYLSKANDAQLEYISPALKLFEEYYDAQLSFISQANTHSMSGVDPARMTKRRAATAPLTKIYMDRSASGALKWVLALYPTHAHAQDADMSLRDYEDFVYGACHVNGGDDPVAHWRRVQAEQDRLVEWLKPHDQVVVRGPNVDLTLSIKDRVFVNADGTKNMPDGEIFTGPVEDSVNGWVRFSYPAIYQGREVEGVEIRFENGKAVKAAAKKNDEFLNSALDTDAGARYLGEFAIGTNFGITRFTRSILFDEKIGGTIHMAFGMGYPETGSRNESGLHWDMICDMRHDSEIRVDGELLYQNGKFQV